MLCAPDGAGAFSITKLDGFAIIVAWMLAVRWVGGISSLAQALSGIPVTWPVLATTVAVAADHMLRQAAEPGKWGGETGALVAILGPTACLMAATIPDPRFTGKFAVAYVAGAAAAGAYGLAQYAGLDPFGWERSFAGGAPASTLGNPLFLGSVLAAGVPLALSGWLRAPTGQGMAWSLSLMIVSAALRAAQARGAWVGAVVSLALLGRDPAVLAAVRGRVGRRRLAGWGLAVAGMIGAWSLPGSHNPASSRLVEHAAAAVKLEQWRGRMMIWEVTAGILRREPVGGGGLGAVRRGYQSEQGKLLADPRYADLPYRTTGHSHQDWLQWSAERGIVGLGLLLWAVVASLASARGSPDPARRALGCAVAGWCVDAWVNGPLHVAPTAQLFWVFLGIAGGRSAVRRTPDAGGGMRIITGLGVALLVARPFARDLLGDRYLAEGQRDATAGRRQEGLAHLIAADSLLREDRRQHLHAGKIWYEGGRFDEAIRSYTLDVERNPGLHSGWHNLGLGLRAAGRFREAREAFRRALALNPRDLETRRLAEAGAALEHGKVEKRW